MYAASEEAAERLALGTHRLVDRGGYEEAIPDFTRAMASDLDFLELPAQEPRADFLSPFLQPGTRDWEEFFDTRKVVRREAEDGTPIYSVTSNIADALSSPSAPREKERGVKKFEVAQLLTDVQLMERFGIKGIFRADLKNMAVVNTVRAAELLQRKVREYDGYERSVVTVGKYAYSWKAARERLKLQASRFPSTSVATSALFVGDKIFIYGTDEYDESSWRVFGPEKVASLVRLVHRMVAATSCESVIFALGPELTILDIDVHDGSTVLSPYREGHAGPHDDLPIGMPTTMVAGMSINHQQTLTELCQAVETIAIGGEDCASAVRITSRYLLVNNHVAREQGEFTSNGRPLIRDRMVSSELWLARCDGPETAWHLRAPVVGEEVVLCYRRHSELQMSDPVKVVTVGVDVLAVSRNECMRPGTSGAAVVALRDFALLGLYDGLALRTAIVASFSPKMYTEVCSYSEAGSDSHLNSPGLAKDTYLGLKNRGLGKIVDVSMASVVPLYTDSVHVGMGFCNGEDLYTLCDPNAAPLAAQPFGTPLIFSKVGEYHTASLPGNGASAPAVTRKPCYGEGVFIIGKDEQGDYYTNSSAKVVHVGVDAAFFRISPLTLDGALPLMGGLVVAYSDAAVVGCFAGSRICSGAQVGFCRSMPEFKVCDVEPERAEFAIKRLFPFLRPDAWAPGIAQAVLNHSSIPAEPGMPTMAALAMVGDSAMRTHLWVQLMDNHVPTNKWQGILQRDQANACQVRKCEELGLSKLIRVGPGAHVPAGSKVHADLLEALAGAVYLNESADVFDTFCEVVSAVKKEYEEGAA